MPSKKPQQNQLSRQQIQQVATNNLKLVYKIAWRHRVRPQDSYTREDLISEGTIGLMRAIELCDFKSGKTYSTFFGKYIEGAILTYLRDKRYLIKSRDRVALWVNSADATRIEDGDPLINAIAAPWSPVADDQELLEVIQSVVKLQPLGTRLVVAATAAGLTKQQVAQAGRCDHRTAQRRLDRVRKEVERCLKS